MSNYTLDRRHAYRPRRSSVARANNQINLYIALVALAGAATLLYMLVKDLPVFK